jgi:NAD(P)H-dependent FMN reductase
MNTTPALTLAVITGSTRVGRLGPRVAAWFRRHAAADERYTVDDVDLLGADLPAHLGDDLSPAATDFVQRVHAADAIVVVTPEYNHGYPATLKQAIDIAGPAWRGKPVGFVSYGGMAGGQRAVEQLRQVFPELRAVTVRETVSFHNPWPTFDERGGHADPESVAPAAKALLDELAWWAGPLRAARAADAGPAGSRDPDPNTAAAVRSGHNAVA